MALKRVRQMVPCHWLKLPVVSVVCICMGRIKSNLMVPSITIQYVHPKLKRYAMPSTYILWTFISTCIYNDSSINNYAPIDDFVWFHVMLHKHKKHTKNPNRASSKMNKHKKHDIPIKLSPYLSQCCKGFEEAY